MKKRNGKSWIPAHDYGRSLRGFGVNLLVRDVEKSLPFFTGVLGVELVYGDPDFAVLRHDGHEWMLHSDHTYDENPLLVRRREDAIRGAGVELRLYGIDPDATETRAKAAGYAVLKTSADKPHGLRDCYLVDRDDYIWVPGKRI